MPGVGRGQLLIRTSRTLVSAGTERMLVDFGKAGLIEKRASSPTRCARCSTRCAPTGCCQRWRPCATSSTSPCRWATATSARWWKSARASPASRSGDRVASNGQHAEVVCVPANLCARVPDGVSDDAAAFTVLGAIALQGIRLAAAHPGRERRRHRPRAHRPDHGAVAAAHGCRVLGHRLRPGRLALARQFRRRRRRPRAPATIPVAAARDFSRGRGVDG